MEYFTHATTIIDEGATIGEQTKIWHFSHVCATAVVGKNCNIGQSVYIDNQVIIGNNCKIQNNVNVYEGVVLEDYVFCGPSMTFTNVKTPRCKYPREKSDYTKTIVCEGASIGAHAVIVCGITINKNALIGSGAVVTKDVPAYAVMAGNPAKRIAWACECGEILAAELLCPKCSRQYILNNGFLEEGK